MSDIIYYVGLRVSDKSTKQLAEWFGFSPASRLHVTLAYSKTWFPYRGDYSLYQIRAPYEMDIFFEKPVLAFNDDAIQFRHEELTIAGATHSFPTYRPHITLPFASSSANPPRFYIELKSEYYRTWKEV